MKLPRHKCGLFLTHNEHRDYYESAEEWIADQTCDDGGSRMGWENEEAKARAIATDEVWTLHWYPDTPIGFFEVAAPTLEELLAYAEKVEKENP